MVRPSLSNWVIVISFLIGGAWVLGRGALKPPLPATKAAAVDTYWVEGSLAAGYSTAISNFFDQHNLMLEPAASRDKAVVIISDQPSGKAWPIKFDDRAVPVVLTSASGQVAEPQSKPVLWLSMTKTWTEIDSGDVENHLVADLKKLGSAQTWSLKALGDIIIGRMVYIKMQGYKDMSHPWLLMGPEVAKSDLTVGNLENAFSDSQAVIAPDGMTFVSPVKALGGFGGAGIDAVNLANNHSFNAGAGGFLDTMTALQQSSIKYFGGGRNASEAHKPLVIDVNGTRVALLGYSSIVGTSNAGVDSPGQAYLSMAPWGPLTETYVVDMETDIKKAKQMADVVVVYYHWGSEYTHEANDDQRQVAHRAVDAGADLIVGTHPHWVQGIEWYKDHLITYSLGNFIFDQEWSAETKQGTCLDATFQKDQLSSARLVPYQITDYQQPGPAPAAMNKQILNDVFSHSWWPGQ